MGSPVAFRHVFDADQRTSLRKPVRLRAQVRDRLHTRFNIEVIDLSTTGFRVKTIFKLPLDTVMWVTLPRLAGLEATVAWRDRKKNVYGCRFTHPLHPAVFDYIVALSGRSIEQ